MCQNVTTRITLDTDQLSSGAMGPQRSENVRSFCYFSGIIQLNFLTDQSAVSYTHLTLPTILLV